jgi:hypothetical protein
MAGAYAACRRVLAALFSRATMWSLLTVSSGGVLMTWLVWANPHPTGLPIGPASTTFLFLFGIAVLLEVESRTRKLRAEAAPASDPRVVVPIICRYHGVFLGMHTWIAIAPIAADELRKVRIAVGMVAGGATDRPERLDVVVHAVQ